MPADSAELLTKTLQALEDERRNCDLRRDRRDADGKAMSTDATVGEALYEHLKSNEYVYAVFQHLEHPLYLPEAVQRIHL